jgi:hypothetical protein
MNPRIIAVQPLQDYALLLTFTNNEKKVFDVKPYLTKGIFTQLKDASNFNSVKVFNGTVLWQNDIDLCPDTLYLDSVTPQ